MRAHSIQRMAGVAALLVLPMLGVWLAGYPISNYVAFPPPEGLYVAHEPFSMSVFIGLAVLELAAIFVALIVSRRGSSSQLYFSTRVFPWWGWAGLAGIALAWIVAWSRFDWFSSFQRHTFTPLWIFYIVVVNALTYCKSGRCLLTNHTAYILKLFPLSAAFWWFFEYLNRFVQNWTYLGVEGLSPSGYFFFATLSFSTVLPAVMSTSELLEAWSVAHRADDRPVRAPSRVSITRLFVLSFSSLLFLGIAPNALFPLVWLAPLGLLMFFQSSDFFPRVFPTVGTFLRLSLAALICGFFWEMWNYHSFAKWIYHVPYVEGYRIFEMPILGYFGYLPFGWECAWLAGMISRNKHD